MQSQTFKISLEGTIKSKLALTAVAVVLTRLDIYLKPFKCTTCIHTVPQLNSPVDMQHQQLWRGERCKRFKPAIFMYQHRHNSSETGDNSWAGQSTHKLFECCISPAAGRACCTDCYTCLRPKHSLSAAREHSWSQTRFLSLNTVTLARLLRTHQKMMENLLKIHLQHPSKHQHIMRIKIG